jgi:putative transposase
VHVIAVAADLGQLSPDVRAHVARDLLHASPLPADNVTLGLNVVTPWCNRQMLETPADIRGPQRLPGRGADAAGPHVEGVITGGRRMLLLYNYRLDPQPRHRVAFGKAFGCVRVVFNDGLAARQQAHAAGQPYLTDADLSARLTAAKATPERAWLGEVSAVILQQSLADLNRAYRNFFTSLTGERKGRKVARPRFRSRKDTRQSIRFTANARFKVLANGRLRLPKIGDVPVRWSRSLPSAPSSVTVIRDSAGRYFASFVVETEPGPLPAAESVVGIDLGLKHFAVLSDGRKIASPRFFRRAEKKLRRAQRSLSRKQDGSANRAKARLRVARVHARVADARREFCHQLSTALIRENQAVAVEDLCVRGLARSRLGKSVHDAGWSAFTGMLEYKARLYGREFRRVGRFVPTSQTCSACGVKDGPKPLHVRTWRCGACGVWLDRDVNAAVNVAVAAGLAVTACGAQVRRGSALAQRSETGTHPKPRPEPA